MFKTRKNKSFNYQSVLSKKHPSSASQIKAEDRNFVSKWKHNRAGNRKVRGVLSLRTLIIVLIILLICMYLLDSKFNG